MNKRAIIASIIGGILIILGLAMAAGGFLLSGSDITLLGTEEWEMNTYSITEDFSMISVDTNTADIVFLPSEGGECRVECSERKNLRHSVSAEGGTLAIKLVDNRKWYEYISLFSFGEDKITVYLPKTEYEDLSVKNGTGHVDIPNGLTFENINVTASTGDVKLAASAAGDVRIKTSTGSIKADGISADKLELTVSTGRVALNKVVCTGNINILVSTGKAILTDVTCRDLFSEGSTGDITLKNVIASGSFDIERSTGDVYFDACDAAAVKVETDTGDVEGTFLTDKIFAAKTDTGAIRVPTSVKGGLCEIETDTGDIRVEIVN